MGNVKGHIHKSPRKQNKTCKFGKCQGPKQIRRKEKKNRREEMHGRNRERRKEVRGKKEGRRKG